MPAPLSISSLPREVQNMLLKMRSAKPRRWKPPRAPKSVRVTIADGVVTIHGMPRCTMNSRLHWRAKDAWAKPFRAAGKEAGRLLGITAPCRVVMTRYSSGELDDDAIGPALKAVRDGIADSIGMRDDKKLGWVWVPQQAKCGPKEGRVEVYCGIIK